MKTKQLILLLLSMGLLLNTSCIKKLFDGDLGPCKIDYRFEVPISVSPIQESFAIGDTIWIEADFAEILKDQNTDDEVNAQSTLSDLADYGLIKLKIRELTNDSIPSPEPEYVNTKFDFIEEERVYNNLSARDIKFSNTRSLNFSYKENQYRLKTGVILKKKGKYSLNIGFINSTHTFGFEGSPRYYRKELTETECVERITGLYFKINEHTIGNFDTNYRLLAEYPNVVPSHYLEKEFFLFQANDTFSFVVE